MNEEPRVHFKECEQLTTSDTLCRAEKDNVLNLPVAQSAREGKEWNVYLIETFPSKVVYEANKKNIWPRPAYRYWSVIPID